MYTELFIKLARALENKILSKEMQDIWLIQKIEIVFLVTFVSRILTHSHGNWNFSVSNLNIILSMTDNYHPYLARLLNLDHENAKWNIIFEMTVNGHICFRWLLQPDQYSCDSESSYQNSLKACARSRIEISVMCLLFWWYWIPVDPWQWYVA